MNLYTKIIITTFIPMIFITAVGIFQVTHLLRELEINIEHSYRTQAELATSRLDDIAYDHDYVTKILSSVKEVAYAVENNDNNTLYEWGENFLSPRLTSVAFVDLKGIIISRSPDEYRFGDSIAKTYAFRRLLESDKYFGISFLDGDEQLVSGRIIKKYGEVPVGYIIVTTAIDSNLMNQLNFGLTGAVGYSSESKNIHAGSEKDAAKKLEIFYRFNDNEINKPSFHIYLAKSQEHTNLLMLKNKMLFMSLTALALILVLLIILFKIHLKPYRRMLGCMTDFNEKTIDIAELKTGLADIKTDDNHELSQVIMGLSGMIEMVQEKMDLLSSKNSQLDKLSKTDALTSLFNRMYLDTALLSEANRAGRYSTSVSVIMLDIDHFKNINDTLGHQTGDQVLIELAKMLIRNTRNTDIIGRWGGEEFMIVCPETNLHDAVLAGEKIHAIMNCSEFAGIRITVSMGICELRPGESVSSLVKRADDALYSAKMSGRNCIRT